MLLQSMRQSTGKKRNLITQFFEKINREKYSLKDVFTPATAATLTFVERDQLEEQFDRALLIPGMQLIIYGQSGSGKTTIIHNTLQRWQLRSIVTACDRETTINQLLMAAFDKLNVFYTSEYCASPKSNITAELTNAYLALKVQTGFTNDERKQRALPVQLTPQRLAEFMGAAGLIWIIEDFHKVKNEERAKLADILKVFVDEANTYHSLKVVAIGAVGTAREMVNYSPDLSNRIAEIHIPLMTRNELEHILVKGEKLLNIQFDHTIHEEIIKLSNALAAICHQLSFSICYKHNIKVRQKVKRKIPGAAIEEAVLDYLKQNSDSFKEILDKALKLREGKPDTKGILQALCFNDKDEMTKKEIAGFPGNKKAYGTHIQYCLHLLTTPDYGEILRYDENSGRYSFSNPFFKAYALMHFTMEESSGKVDKYDFYKFEELMKYLKSEVINTALKNMASDGHYEA